MELERPLKCIKIAALSGAGDTLAADRDWSDAISKYNEAWKIAPEPKSKWEARTWLLVAIVAACFFSEYHQLEPDALRYAICWPMFDIKK